MKSSVNFTCKCTQLKNYAVVVIATVKGDPRRRCLSFFLLYQPGLFLDLVVL